MPVYTKKGDKGETGFLDKSKRVGKDSAKVEALGSLDELNSFLGIVRSCSTSPDRFAEDIWKKDAFVQQIQGNLFTICAILAGSKLKFSKSETTRLEKEIDIIEAKIGKIDSFRYSQGTTLATHLMYARALARRAERQVVSLSKEEKILPQILQYVNRLSDMLFMLFREANFSVGVEEVGWKPTQPGRN